MVVSVALTVVAVVALTAFGLVLVLARRLRTVTERVSILMSALAGESLPLPGTPVPEFDAVSTAGEHVTNSVLAYGERVFALLSAVCESCQEQIAALLQSCITPEPLVLVIGPPQERAAMVRQLDGHAIVIEEGDRGLVAGAFKIGDFPAVLLVQDGVIQRAGHTVADVLESLTSATPGAVSAQPG